MIDAIIKNIVTSMEKDRDEYKNADSATINMIKEAFVYPSTYLANFLLEKIGFRNPSTEELAHYGTGDQGPGVYKQLIEKWNDSYAEVEDCYWDELCEYHLNRIAVAGHGWEKEELCYYDLIPMELMNVFKVREKLGLDAPVIKHELFNTIMATPPVVPTGYNADLDVKLQMVEWTIKHEKVYTQAEIVQQLAEEHGEGADLFF
ncbi:MAG: hypothetical protein FWG53_08055 [Clostridiales bacterium]|nr:hypothetical protein [Clostridiales bacterium]